MSLPPLHLTVQGISWIDCEDSARLAVNQFYGGPPPPPGDLIIVDARLDDLETARSGVGDILAQSATYEITYRFEPTP